MARLTHITPHAQSGGGMQGVIRQHRVIDGALGHESIVAALFEEPSPVAEIGLGGTGWWTPGRLAGEFRRQVAPVARDSVAIYHNAWGMPLLAPADGAARRLAYLHTEWPGLDAAVRASAQWSDGFLAVSDALVSAVRRAVPSYPAGRIWRISYAASPPAGFVASGGARAGGRPFRVGYVGRLEVRQKRVDRLAQMLRRSGEDFEWHVIGDGAARRRLEAAAAPGRVHFHGWLEGKAYWETLAGLEAVVFFSDFEGTPVALVEAMSLGVVPLFPSIGGGGEELVRQVDRRCLYPAGDLDAASRQLKALLREGIAGSERIRSVVSGFTAEGYAASVERIVAFTAETERYSATGGLRPARWSDRMPLAAVHRWYERAIWC